MSFPQIQLLEQKIAFLQADTIIYQQQISRLRKRLVQSEEYRIKYELLLEKHSQDYPLHQNRRTDQINSTNKKIDNNNQKWTSIKDTENSYRLTIQQLQLQNQQLNKRIANNQNHSQTIQSIDKFKDELKFFKQTNLQLSSQLETLNQQNLQLSSQIKTLNQKNFELTQSLQTFHSKQINFQELQRTFQYKIHQSRNEQKNFYRNQILELENKLKQMKEEIAYYKIRASPEREQQIIKLQIRIQQIDEENNQQIYKLTELIKNKNQEIGNFKSILSLAKSEAEQYAKTLQIQLQKCRSRIFNSEQEHHAELMAYRMEMEQMRLKQVHLLKESFKNLEESHDAERQQWNVILKQQQDELMRIKSMWQEEKNKFYTEKNKMKAKISELQAKQNKPSQEEKQNLDRETQKLIQSLKQIDEEQNKCNDYETNVIFLSRQLKRATVKIEQKQRQTSKLLKDLTAQRQQFQNETELIKKAERQQSQYYKQKLSELDDQNTRLLQQLRQKDRQIREFDSKYRTQIDQIRNQNLQLQNMMKEMEQDYHRMNQNKQNLYQSYRSQRDMVFGGKIELNQEKKKKFIHLARQKNQLQISYKERERQIKISYQLKINSLQENINKINRENQITNAELQILKKKFQQIGQNLPSKRKNEQNLKDLHKKIATLDLEISLAQNLYSTINSVRNRAKNAAKQQNAINQIQSIQSINSKQRNIHDFKNHSQAFDQLAREHALPTFLVHQGGDSAEQMKNSAGQMADSAVQMKNYTFKPQQQSIKLEKRTKIHQKEISFHSMANENMQDSNLRQ